ALPRCTLFPSTTLFRSDEVRAESQFAVVRRPLAPPPPRVRWVEPPVPTAHTLGAVALGQLVLLTKGLPEYEASSDGLRLTLLRRSEEHTSELQSPCNLV